MPIVGIFEDEFGLIPADPGRMIYIPNIPPAPPLPAIPSGTFQPPSQMIYLSILTPVYTNVISYGSGVTITATFTFNGYTMGASYAFSCGGHTNVVSVPSMFDKDMISWYDQDKTLKATPADPALLTIPLPLLMGNHVDNPHTNGDDIVVKLESGKTYVIRGAVCAEQSLIDDADKDMNEIFEGGAHCYYLDSDTEGFNAK